MSENSANGWMICPSKRYPGKFYYFHVGTGETAWTLNNIDRFNRATRNSNEEGASYNNYPKVNSSATEDCLLYNSYMPDFNQMYPTNIYFNTPMQSYHESLMPYSYCIWPFQQPLGCFTNNQTIAIQTKTDQQTQTFDLTENHVTNSPSTSLPENISSDDNNRDNVMTEYRNESEYGSNSVHSMEIDHISIEYMEHSPNASHNNNNFVNEYNNFRLPDERSQNSARENNLNRYKGVSQSNNNEINSNNNINNLNADKLAYEKQNNSTYINRSTDSCQSAQNGNFNNLSKNAQNVSIEMNKENTICWTTNINTTSMEEKSESNAIIDSRRTLNIDKVNSPGVDSRKRLFLQFEQSNNYKNIDENILISRKNDNTCESLSIKRQRQDTKMNDCAMTKINNGTTAHIPLGLSNNDLRFKLLARNQKKGNICTSGYNKSVSNKHISLDLQDNSEIDIEKNYDIMLNEEQKTAHNKKIGIETLRNLGDIETRDDPWFIMTDIDILLDHFDFIEQFIKQDPNCRLTVARAVFNEINARCSNDRHSRNRVVAARQMMRRLALPSPHIVVEPAKLDKINNNNTENLQKSIVECCVTLLERNCHVVVITDDDSLYQQATDIVDCFSLQDIKGNGESHEALFEIQNYTSCGNVHTPIVNEHTEDVKSNHRCTKSNVVELTEEESTDTTDDLETGDMFKFKKPYAKVFKKNEHKSKEEIKEDEHVLNENQNFKGEDTNENLQSPNRMLSVEDILEQYRVKNKDTADRIVMRLSEWMCHFTQTMEDVLYDVLFQHIQKVDKLNSPWILYECLEGLPDAVTQNGDIKTLTAKLSRLLVTNSPQGKINKKITPDDFMKILGCGVLLLKSLKKTFPNIEDIHSAIESVENLICEIENPTLDLEDLTKRMTTPVPSCKSLVYKSTNYTKSHSEIVKYLKAHFTAWKTYEDDSEKENMTSETVRTLGRNLNLVKIYSSKTVKLNKNRSQHTDIDHYNSKLNRSSNNFKVNTSNKNDNKLSITITSDYKFKESANVKSNNDDNINNTFNKDITSNTINDTIFTRKINCIEAFEKKSENDMKPFEEKFSSNIWNEEHNVHSNNSPDTTTKNVINVNDLSNIDEQFNETKVVCRASSLFEYEEKLRKKSLHSTPYSEHDTDSVGIRLPVNFSTIDANNASDSNEHNKLNGVALVNTEEDMYISSEYNTELDKSSSTTEDFKIIKINETDVNAIANRQHWQRNLEVSGTNMDMINDNGLDCESACSFVRTFFKELSGSLKRTYKFIQHAVATCRKHRTNGPKKEVIKLKTKNHLAQIEECVKCLKRISLRESNDSSSLKMLLKRTGSNCSEDTRIKLYNEVIKKCLEQAEILRQALRALQNITSDNFSSFVTNLHLDMKTGLLHYPSVT